VLKSPEKGTFDATFGGFKRLNGWSEGNTSPTILREPTMKRPTILLAALILTVAPAYAQTAADLFGGDLPQQYGRDLENRFSQMTVDDMAADPAYLESIYAPEVLKSFFSGTFVKVSLYPDGSYAVLSQPGGEVQGFKLGKAKVETSGQTWDSDGWNLKAGEYAAPKRRAPLTISIAAGGQKMDVECKTKFERSDHAITFYIGPMNGMQCLGIADDSVLSAYDLVKVAEGTMVASIPASGS
jgi:hypothetical protein